MQTDWYWNKHQLQCLARTNQSTWNNALAMRTHTKHNDLLIFAQLLNNIDKAHKSINSIRDTVGSASQSSIQCETENHLFVGFSLCSIVLSKFRWHTKHIQFYRAQQKQLHHLPIDLFELLWIAQALKSFWTFDVASCGVHIVIGAEHEHIGKEKTRTLKSQRQMERNQQKYKKKKTTTISCCADAFTIRHANLSK